MFETSVSTNRSPNFAAEKMNVRAFDGSLLLFGDGAFAPAKLQRRQPIAMDDSIGVGSIMVLTRSNDQAGLAMGFDAFAHQLHARLQNEIARELLPHQVELIALRPHVRARRGNRVLLRHGVVCRRARDLWRADVAMAIKVAELGRLCVEKDRGSGGNEREQGQKNS
jgi:hypothetical protein